MPKRRAFVMKDLPQFSELERQVFLAPHDLLSELRDLTLLVSQHSQIALSTISRAPAAPPRWPEIEAWMRSPGQEKVAKRHLYVTLSVGIEAAMKETRDRFMAAHPHRATKIGRPLGSGPDARRQTLLGITLGLLLEAGGERLRKRLQGAQTSDTQAA